MTINYAYKLTVGFILYEFSSFWVGPPCLLLSGTLSDPGGSGFISWFFNRVLVDKLPGVNLMVIRRPRFIPGLTVGFSVSAIIVLLFSSDRNVWLENWFIAEYAIGLFTWRIYFKYAFVIWKVLKNTKSLIFCKKSLSVSFERFF